MKVNNIIILLVMFVIVCFIAALPYGIYLYNKKGDNDKQTDNNKSNGRWLIGLGSITLGVLLINILFFARGSIF